MNRYSIFALSVFLTACGGSGSSNLNLPLANATGVNPALADVAGLYDATYEGDESYLYISESGDVEAYDFQGDGFGNGFNCYSLAVETHQINSALHGGKITYSSSGDRYTIEKADVILSFDYDEVNGMSNFLFKNVLSAGIGMRINNPNIYVGGSAAIQVSSPSISDIRSAICS